MPKRGWRKVDGVWVAPEPGSLATVGTAMEDTPPVAVGGDENGSQPFGASWETMSHCWESVPGHFWYREAYARILDEVATSGVPCTWVEVGVFEGQALCWLGVEVWNRSLPVTIVAVDTFAGWPGTKRGPALRDAFFQHTHHLRGRLGERFRVIEASSVVAAEQFPVESIGVVWLDGDHDHTAVRADLAAWQPKVRPGGIIGGDDWAFPGVRDAVKATGRFELVPGSQDGRDWPSWIRRL